MASFASVLSKWPLVRQIREGKNGTGLESMSEKTRATHARIADFPLDKSPEFRPTGKESGLDAIRGDAAFILHEDGFGWLYVASGLQDGPIPTHYEPLKSPVHNALYSRDTNPAVHWFTRQENRFAPPGDSRFPLFLQLTGLPNTITPEVCRAF